MATQTQAQRSASAKKAAATRKRNAASRSGNTTRRSARTTARTATRTATTRTRAELTGLEALAQQAERAVLIPVGAALVARDNVVDAARPFTSRERAERELRKYERRGTTARNGLQRELKRTRTRFERQLRQRRTQASRLLRRNRRSVERGANNLQSNAEDFVQRVQDQVTSLS